MQDSKQPETDNSVEIDESKPSKDDSKSPNSSKAFQDKDNAKGRMKHILF